MRTRAMRHKAWLAWRWVRPEDAGIGETPHRCAKAAPPRSRWGLSPAVTGLRLEEIG